MDKGKELLQFCKSQNIKVVFYSTAMEFLKTFNLQSMIEKCDSFHLDFPGVKPVIFVNDKMPREERIAAVEQELDALLLSRLGTALSNARGN